MAFGSLKVLNHSRQQLGWIGKRQQILSQNLANVTTPGYRAKDLQTLSFPEGKNSGAVQRLSLRKPDHDGTLQKPLLSGSVQSFFIHSDEQKLSGNTVTAEDEVKKMNETSLLHQQVLHIYKQHLTNLTSIF